MKISSRRARAKKRERGAKWYKDITMNGYEGAVSEQVRNEEKPSDLWERQSEREEESDETDRMSYRPEGGQRERERESFHTLRQPGDLELKDTETSSAAKGDRPRGVTDPLQHYSADCVSICTSSLILSTQAFMHHML